LLNNFSFNDAYRIIKNVIDERIHALTRSGAGIEVTWGTVAEVSSPYSASVYLLGEGQPSGEFRLENGLMPNLLDPVRVNIDKRGNRWIDAILNDSTTAFNKLEIDPRGGELRLGDGTVAPAPFSFDHPHAFDITPTLASDGVEVYPDGVSIFGTNTGTADGWPANFATITTFKYSNDRIYQFISSHTSDNLWFRIGHSSVYGGTNEFSTVFQPLTDRLKYVPIALWDLHANVSVTQTAGQAVADISAEVTGVPIGAKFVTGYVIVRGSGAPNTSGSTQFVRTEHYTGGIAGIAYAMHNIQWAVGYFTAELGGTNGRVLKVFRQADNASGQLVYYVRINGYFTDA
jgi:hypothetical protein